MEKEILLIKVIDAKYVNDYKIAVVFNDGLNGVIDLRNEIWGEVFEPLKDKGYFKQFTRDRWTIGWDCGADFAPEFLYELAKKQENKTTTNKVQKAI